MSTIAGGDREMCDYDKGWRPDSDGPACPQAFMNLKPRRRCMSTIEKSVEVNVPVRTAYDQWTQFEEFPRFMEGIEKVTQLDNTHLHWKATIGGKNKEWKAVITEQRPDERIAWKSTDGAKNAGVVTFHRLSDQKSKIMLQMDYEPEGALENVGDAIGAVSLRVAGDLERFKEFIEKRGHETGAWRGEVKGK